MNEWMFSPEVVSSLKKTWKGWRTMTTTEWSDTSNSQYKYKSRLVGKYKCQQHLCLNSNKIEGISVLETARLSYGPSQNWRTLCEGTNLRFPLTSFGRSSEDQTQWTQDPEMPNLSASQNCKWHSLGKLCPQLFGSIYHVGQSRNNLCILPGLQTAVRVDPQHLRFQHSKHLHNTFSSLSVGRS